MPWQAGRRERAFGPRFEAARMSRRSQRLVTTRRWQPKNPNASSFPNVDTLQSNELFKSFIPLLPAPPLPVPRTPPARGHRQRQRAAGTREVILEANCILRSLNLLDNGLCTSKERTNHRRRPDRPRSSQEKMALEQLYERVRQHAADAVRARRGLACKTAGAQVTAMLIKADAIERYNIIKKTHNQVPLTASAVDEPAPGSACNDMLQALPLRERNFYSQEEHVVVLDQRSQIIFDELQEQYGFIGGDYAQYVNYFLRTDVDPDLWHWSDASEVKCIAGVSAVPKKDRSRQRKLLMQVAANYAWQDVDDRSELGMGAGGSLSAVFAPEGHCAMASWDQSNAFTSVRTPSWMWAWTSGPPVRARDVWSRLSQKLRTLLGPMGWAYPRYTRLAMGSAHAVHILMSINFETVGRALWSLTRLGSFDGDRKSVV